MQQPALFISITLSVSGNLSKAIGYPKAWNSDTDDIFGTSLSLTLTVKPLRLAPFEGSEFNDDQIFTTGAAGAVYVY